MVVTTLNEFLKSDELEVMIGKKASNKFRPKFKKIITKAGVGDCDMNDEVAINKLWFGSWNWFASIFHVFWSLYLNITSGRTNNWFILAVLIAIYSLLDVFGLGGELIINFGLALFLFLFFGMLGNGMYLQEIVRRYNRGHRGALINSSTNIFVILSVYIIYAVVVSFVELKT